MVQGRPRRRDDLLAWDLRRRDRAGGRHLQDLRRIQLAESGLRPLGVLLLPGGGPGHRGHIPGAVRFGREVHPVHGRYQRLRLCIPSADSGPGHAGPAGVCVASAGQIRRGGGGGGAVLCHEQSGAEADSGGEVGSVAASNEDNTKKCSVTLLQLLLPTSFELFFHLLFGLVDQLPLAWRSVNPQNI